MEPSVAGLSQHVQALAQELQDIILDFTLAFDPDDKEVQMSKNYKASWQLQINRATREKQAAVYFGTSIFNFGPGPSHAMAIKILKSITADHRGVIATLRCAIDWTEKANASLIPTGNTDRFLECLLEKFHEQFPAHGVSLRRGILQISKPAAREAEKGKLWLSLTDLVEE